MINFSTYTNEQLEVMVNNPVTKLRAQAELDKRNAGEKSEPKVTEEKTEIKPKPTRKTRAKKTTVKAEGDTE